MSAGNDDNGVIITISVWGMLDSDVDLGVGVAVNYAINCVLVVFAHRADVLRKRSSRGVVIADKHIAAAMIRQCQDGLDKIGLVLSLAEIEPTL